MSLRGSRSHRAGYVQRLPAGLDRPCQAQVGGRHFVPSRIRRTNQHHLSVSFPIHSALSTTRPRQAEKSETKCDSRSCFSGLFFGVMGHRRKDINQMLKGLLTSYRLLFGKNQQAQRIFSWQVWTCCWTSRKPSRSSTVPTVWTQIIQALLYERFSRQRHV